MTHSIHEECSATSTGNTVLSSLLGRTASRRRALTQGILVCVGCGVWAALALQYFASLFA